MSKFTFTGSNRSQISFPLGGIGRFMEGSLNGFSHFAIKAEDGNGVVESALTEPLYDQPLHPYTQALLKAIPDFENANSFSELSGDLPDPSNIPPGCPFNPRCPVGD
jgi:oligopeptide/dipeptide ABC transporter ATP-binding protein